MARRTRLRRRVDVCVCLCAGRAAAGAGRGAVARGALGGLRLSLRAVSLCHGGAPGEGAPHAARYVPFSNRSLRPRFPEPSH